MPTPFISTSDVVSYVGRGGTADATMIMAVDAACEIVRDYTQQDFNRGTSTIVLDGNDSDVLLLPQVPVVAAGTVSVNGAAITDYCVNESGLLFRGSAGADPRSRWPSGRQNVVVTYEHGYADVDVPRSVRRIALEVAARTVLQGPMIEEYVGPVRARYAAVSTELTPTERMILDTYRRR